MSIPEDFWCGTSASSAQTEGVAPVTAWARWEAEGRVPPSGEGNGFATNYARDWAMLAEHGLRTHRLSIEWARIEPRPGVVEGGAVDHYLDVLRTAAQAGIAVWVTLHHETLPGWFTDDEGGFLDRHSRGYFWARHVDRMGELFGDAVAGWIPVEDPLGWARRGWLTGEHPPGRQDPGKFGDALRAAHLANLEAWKLLRSGDRPVATSMAVSPVEPLVRSRHPDERVAAAAEARRLDQYVFGCWAAALDDGMFAIPGRAVENIPEFAGAFDLIGFTYDHAIAAYADGTTGPYPADARTDALGQAPWPEGLGLTLRRLNEAGLRRPLFVTGGSVATPADDVHADEWRGEVLRASAVEVERALADGIDLRGVLYGTAVDGYEWTAGFDVHTGLFDRDRRPKPSAVAAAEMAGVVAPS